jgi:DNA-directed RNA polymerase specialized sigma24 family protein
MTQRPTAEALEAALAAMPRMLETTKARMRKHFLEGASLPALASSENTGVEALANAARRVRTKLASPSKQGLGRQVTHAVPVVLQVQKRDLERAFAAMPRIEEDTKRRVRQFFLEGKSATEIALDAGISVETLHNAVRRVRLVLAEQFRPWEGVAVQLVMPAAIAEEMQALCVELMQAPNRKRAEQVMKYTLDSLSIARTEIKKNK